LGALAENKKTMTDNVKNERFEMAAEGFASALNLVKKLQSANATSCAKAGKAPPTFDHCFVVGLGTQMAVNGSVPQDVELMMMQCRYEDAAKLTNYSDGDGQNAKKEAVGDMKCGILSVAGGAVDEYCNRNGAQLRKPAAPLELEELLPSS